MQRDSRYFTDFLGHPHEMDGYCSQDINLGYHCLYDAYGIPIRHPLVPAMPGNRHEFPDPFNKFELQPMVTCPRNFVIFDQTDNKSRVVFHPTLAHKFSYQGLDFQSCPAVEDVKGSAQYTHESDEFTSYSNEDADEIDALLSSDEEDEAGEEELDDDDDDLVSTGRTPAIWGAASHGSSLPPTAEDLNYRMPKRSCTRNSYPSCASSCEKKRERMKTMVDALKGIIPGTEQMDTPAILDEAVKYLKSLKVEVKKLGIQNLEHSSAAQHALLGLKK